MPIWGPVPTLIDIRSEVEVTLGRYLRGAEHDLAMRATRPQLLPSLSNCCITTIDEKCREPISRTFKFDCRLPCDD